MQPTTLSARQVESAPFSEVAIMVDPILPKPKSLPRPSRSILAYMALVLTTALAAGLLGPIAASGQDEAAEGSGDLSGQSATVDGPDSVFPDIMFPTVGPAAYVDTWGACRGSGCSRGHRGVDIFAIKLAPVVAAEDGVITGVRRSGMGISGNTVIIESDAGWRYLYIHLNNDAPGSDDGSNPQAWITANRLKVGDRVSAGDVIGYLGDSGNAEGTPSHVHFEVHQPGVGAINPTPVVQAARDAGRVVSVSSLASTAEGRAEHAPTVTAWYQALLKRDPTAPEMAAWTDRMDIGFANTNDLIADLTMAPARRNLAGPVVRSFAVTLQRRPSLNELRQWEDAMRNGTDLNQMNAILLDSAPFVERHGEMSDQEFIAVIHENATGTAPTEQQMNDALEMLTNGGARSELASYWADSYTVKNSTWRGLEVMQAYRAGLDRLPTPEEYDAWVAHLNSGGLIPDVVESIRAGETAEADAGSDNAGTDAENDNAEEDLGSENAEEDAEEDAEADTAADQDSDAATDADSETVEADVDNGAAATDAEGDIAEQDANAEEDSTEADSTEADSTEEASTEADSAEEASADAGSPDADSAEEASADTDSPDADSATEVESAEATASAEADE